ncbi:MAG: hypothetical protein HUJ26_15875 [Planctomycetaceae bacterium]|nr:hypothetical protein [Planctomycetaceae bacterium]
MKNYSRLIVLTGLFVAGTIGFLVSSSPSSQAASAPEKEISTEPVEPDMHEFMEYVFQPTFKQLKPAMATEPTDNQGWKTIKANSLVLAEGGNLLLIRQPKEGATDWSKHSDQVRGFGGKLYRAAKSKDFKMARKHYESMIRNCNACHEQFAGGEHILKP